MRLLPFTIGASAASDQGACRRGGGGRGDSVRGAFAGGCMGCAVRRRHTDSAAYGGRLRGRVCWCTPCGSLLVVLNLLVVWSRPGRSRSGVRAGGGVSVVRIPRLGWPGGALGPSSLSAGSGGGGFLLWSGGGGFLAARWGTSGVSAGGRFADAEATVGSNVSRMSLDIVSAISWIVEVRDVLIGFVL